MGAEAMDIDRQRNAAMRALEALDFSYEGDRRLPTADATLLINLTAETDAVCQLWPVAAAALAPTKGRPSRLSV
jgi:hypothetical protein